MLSTIIRTLWSLHDHESNVVDLFCNFRIFNKVKSRSAHMKSHRPPDAEPKKAKLDPHKMEAAEQTLGRAMGVSTTIGRHT